MLFWHFTTLNTYCIAVIEIVTADTVKTGEAIGVIGFRAMVAIDVHSADEEL